MKLEVSKMKEVSKRWGSRSEEDSGHSQLVLKEGGKRDVGDAGGRSDQT
jgi:hypothetical protein